MKRKLFLLLIMVAVCTLAAFAVAGCAANSVGNNDFGESKSYGKIGDFSAIAPVTGSNTLVLPVFSWTKAANADSYTLEVCSTEFFDVDDTVYVKKTGITAEEGEATVSFSVGFALKSKNTEYFWRVTAENADTSKRFTNGYESFYLSAAAAEEIPVDISYADEWTVHKVGSHADVSIDKTDFFGNGKDSLVVSFVEEDTNQGAGYELSDGWVVVTHNQEMELYGVDAFYFNFYYSGNDAQVYLRVTDEDNEYWHAKIKLANNAKQTVIIKFSEFEQRTRDAVIANGKFDYNYIKSYELVYEKAFGDGITYFSDLRAVSVEKYSHLFIEDMDFGKVQPEDVTTEGYVFDTEVSDGGKTLTYSFDTKANDKNEKGINVTGYGFVKHAVNKLLVSGDAFNFKVSTTGNISSATILLRVVEEDGDRWVYEQKVSAIPEDGYITVPFVAFTLSEYKGDGTRQFYFIKQMQYGIRNPYSPGSVSISDLSVVKLAEIYKNLYTVNVAQDGTLDNFDGYKNNVEAYYTWMLSSTNKDEAIVLDTANAFGTANTCAKFGYKADMGLATYTVNVEGHKDGFNALELWAKDDSQKADNAFVSYIKNVSAEMQIAITLITGERYHYQVKSVNKYWTRYLIPFAAFVLDSEFSESDATKPLCTNIMQVEIAFQYYYYQISGAPYPVYTSGNSVYVDSVKFAVAEGNDAVTESLAKQISPLATDAKIAVVDNFDNGKNAWKISTTTDYSSLSLSEDTFSGEGGSLQMGYKGNSDSVSYMLDTVFDSAVNAKGIKLLMKGDGKATVYVNLYLKTDNASYKYRAEINNVSSEWTYYTIGFGNFKMVEGTGSATVSKTSVPNINKISFGIVNNKDSELSSVLLDEFVFDGYIANYSDFKTEAAE